MRSFVMKDGLPLIFVALFFFQAMVISGVVNSLAAIVIFVYILPRRDRESMSAYMLGWGFIIPMSFVLPFQLVRFLELENVAVIFGFIAIPAYLPFRCIGTYQNILLELHVGSLLASSPVESWLIHNMPLTLFPTNI